MAKTFKLILGIGFIGIALIYLLGIAIVVVETKSSAVYNMNPYVAFSYDGCEKIENPEVHSIESPQYYANDYTCYRMYFTAYNYSTERYPSNPADMIWWEGNVLYVDNENRDTEYEKLFYEGASPCLPGKREMRVSMYIFVENGVDQLRASYNPNWKEDEVFLDVSLHDPI